MSSPLVGADIHRFLVLAQTQGPGKAHGHSARHIRAGALMLSPNLIFVTSLAYVALLFMVAFLGDRQARSGKASWIKSPIVYTLSISVYCTSWTFYGAVGSAVRSGLEFAPSTLA